MRNQLTPEQSRLHPQAMDLSERYRALEAELCACLREVDRTRLYKKLGHRSLFQYAVRALRLAESVAYAFITVARKSSEIPELKCAIETHSLSVSKASRVASALTAENAREVLAFAQTHTSREIDHEMARRNPQTRKRDLVKPIHSDTFEVRAHVSKATLEKLERAQSLLAQKGKSTEIEAVLEAALEEFLNRHDPVRKAERAQKRAQTRRACHTAPERAAQDDVHLKVQAITPVAACEKRISSSPKDPVRPGSIHKLRPSRVSQNEVNQNETNQTPSLPDRVSPIRSGTRVPLSAEVKHAVFLRDQGRCTHIDEQGERCGSERWIDIHHLKPVSCGGTNELSNLTTLCSFHHDLVHQLSFPLEGQFNWLRAPRVVYQA